MHRWCDCGDRLEDLGSRSAVAEGKQRPAIETRTRDSTPLDVVGGIRSDIDNEVEEFQEVKGMEDADSARSANKHDCDRHWLLFTKC